MPVGLAPPGKLLPVRGVRLAATAAGIKKNGQSDMVLFALREGSHAAATFTRNAFCAAPVTVSREHLHFCTPRALLINSGNANAGTGEQGLHDARESCARVASLLAVENREVLPFSTGVIGEPLPMEKVTAGIGELAGNLQEDAWMDAANAIMTTDTIPKGVSKTLQLGGEPVVITGIVKGSGMIHPDMATMLCFIATDANVESAWLQSCLAAAVDASFNCITVDGDTSTNDACVLLATGVATPEPLDGNGDDSTRFAAAVHDVCRTLAQSVIRDAEGASKFVTVRIDSAVDAGEARRVGFAIAHSPLVKTALFASDPNWGRILAVVGRAGVLDLEIEAVSIFLDEVCIVEKGARAAGYSESDGQRVMQQDEITVRVVLGRGRGSATIWTSDLSHEYVRINAEYRS